MYRRSYGYTTTPEQREEFMKLVEHKINSQGYFCIFNDFPYDMCRNKEVKTDHWTLFYTSINDVYSMINTHIRDGYTVQINSSDNQTIPEIQHLHFIKIIDE